MSLNENLVARQGFSLFFSYLISIIGVVYSVCFVMYLALLGRFYGSDNIVRYTGTRDPHRKMGDLLVVGGKYALVLGDKVTR